MSRFGFYIQRVPVFKKIKIFFFTLHTSLGGSGIKHTMWDLVKLHGFGEVHSRYGKKIFKIIKIFGPHITELQVYVF